MCGFAQFYTEKQSIGSFLQCQNLQTDDKIEENLFE